MNPIDFPGSNVTLKAPPDTPNCSDMRCLYDTVHNCYYSRWEMSEVELKEVMETKTVFVAVFGSPPPPIAVVATIYGDRLVKELKDVPRGIQTVVELELYKIVKKLIDRMNVHMEDHSDKELTFTCDMIGILDNPEICALLAKLGKS